MVHLIEHLVELERDVSYQESPSGDEPEFRYEPGDLPVLLSAPHGAVHTRQGQPKQEENYTAAFVRLLARWTGAHALYARRKSNTDPNWYRDAPYKICLGEIVNRAGIGLVLDLHGAAARRGFGIAIGTMRGTSCPGLREPVVAELERHGFRPREERSPGSPGTLELLDIDGRFTAIGVRDQETITRFAWERLHVPAIQFELHEQLRMVAHRPDVTRPAKRLAIPEQVEWMLQALSDVVRLVGASLPPRQR